MLCDRPDLRGRRLRGEIGGQAGRVAGGLRDDDVAVAVRDDRLDVGDLVAGLDREVGRLGAQLSVVVDLHLDLLDAVDLAALAEDAHRARGHPEGLVHALDLVVHLAEEILVPPDALRSLVHRARCYSSCARGVHSRLQYSSRDAYEAREAAPLLVDLGEGRGSPLLAGPEGARRAGDRVRGRARAGPAREARPARTAERPAKVSRDRVRGRDHLPRGVQGHGRAHQGRKALRGARPEPGRIGASLRLVAKETPEPAGELRKLLLVTDTALAHLSLEALLDELLVRIRDVLEADTAAFLLLDEAARELVARAATGLEEEVERGVRIPLGRGFAGRVADERRPLSIEDVDHADVLNPLLREKGVKSLLGAPLIARDRVIGVIHVGTLETRRFCPEDVELLQRATERAALGVERAVLYEELRRLDETRHRFISLASHELRTPAAAVYGAAATLRGRARDLAPEVAEELQKTLYEQSARLAGLIEQLLDLSRVEAHAVEIKPERILLADRVKAIVEAFAGSTDITLHVPDGLEAEIDPVVLERVLTNLLINALRHGAPPIVVSARRADRHLRIAVDDRGPGVPEDFRALLF